MQGKKLVFVTNNSSKSRKQYAKKFLSLGVDVSEVMSIQTVFLGRFSWILKHNKSDLKCLIQQDEIFSSSFAAAMYLKLNNFPQDKKVGLSVLEVLCLCPWSSIVMSYVFHQFRFEYWVQKTKLMLMCVDLLQSLPEDAICYYVCHLSDLFPLVMATDYRGIYPCLLLGLCYRRGRNTWRIRARWLYRIRWPGKSILPILQMQLCFTS